MYYLYILKSRTFPKTYVGISDNIERRLKEHNSGHSKFTQKYTPWDIIHTETLPDRPAARIREKYYKSAAGRRVIKKLFDRFPIV
jgi:putative endonuclease